MAEGLRHKMRVLLTGKNGQLGRCFQAILANSNEFDVIAFDSTELNITDSISVNAMIAQAKPDVVVNAAAYTAVDKAETEIDAAFSVNEKGIANLARAAAVLNIPIIHVSTDYVFNGQGVEPYLPTDSVGPIGVYGRSKLAGEQALIKLTPQHIILRTAWVFSEYGNNFVKTMLRLAQDRDQLSIVADQYGSPTDARDIALTIKRFCQLIANGQAPWGIYHFAGNQPTSWHGFARAIFVKALQQGLIGHIPTLNAIDSTQFPTLAERPSYSVLKDPTLQSRYGIEPSDWLTGLDRVLSQLRPE